MAEKVIWLEPEPRATLEAVTRKLVTAGVEPEVWIETLSYRITQERGYSTTYFDPLRISEIVRKAAFVLPTEIVTADDALGWAHQAAQFERKGAINRAEEKIGGKDLFPVTQLMTEPYMVLFLLQNSLGAWWAARHPESPLVADWEYLLKNTDGSPAAGEYPGWPKTAAELKIMDPCCGSGHFLMEAFCMVSNMRQEEEGLSVAEAGDAAFRDNLHGLDLDPVIARICRMQLAMCAWRTGGYRTLPSLKIERCDLPIPGLTTQEEAENLGSLIGPLIYRRMMKYLGRIQAESDALVIPPKAQQLNLFDEAA